jgi:transketolase
MVHESILANSAGKLNATIINVSQIKPLPKNEIIAEALKTKRVVVVEEHSVIGGLGEAIGAILSQSCPMPTRLVTVPDTFPFSVLTETPNVYGRYGISYEDIIRAVNSLGESEVNS